MIKSKKGLFDIGVDFGGVSIGDMTARLGVRIERASLPLEQADELLCGRRLEVKIGFGRKSDSPGQKLLIEDLDETIEATVDVHRFGVSTEEYSTGLTFRLKEIDVGTLARFSKGSGRLVVHNVELIPEDVVEEKESNTEPIQFKAEGPWRKVSLDDLFSGAILKALKGEGLATLGDLTDYQEPNQKTGYTKQLTDIKGIGEAAATKIGDRLIKFWEDNPQYQEGAE